MQDHTPPHQQFHRYYQFQYQFQSCTEHPLLHFTFDFAMPKITWLDGMGMDTMEWISGWVRYGANGQDGNDVRVGEVKSILWY